MSKLPRGIERLLSWTIPGDQLDPIVGDLLEERDAMARRRSPGAAPRAWIAAWRTAVQLAAFFIWERMRRDRALPPIADEAPVRAPIVESLAQDVFFGVRMLGRQRGFTAVALAALALGIGANTATFSVVDAVLWRPLPFHRPDRIVSLAEQRPKEGRWFGPIAPADFFDWRRDSRSFAAIAAYTVGPASGAYNLTGIGEPERVRPLAVSPAFLAVLGIAPALGRDFKPDEATVGRHHVVLLTDGLWRRRFGSDTSIVGHTIAFDGNPFEIVGVLPARFWWPTAPDVVVPLALSDHDRSLRGAHFLGAIARLSGDTSIDRAREEMRVISARLSAEYAAENADHAANLRPLRDAFVGGVRPALLVLLGAVAFVLMIACANVATLLLARAAGRVKEISIRRAVGASRARIVQQMMIESLVIAVTGGAAGLLVAWWALSAVRPLLPAQFTTLPGIAAAGLDGRVLAATFGFSIATGLLFGIVPALVSSDRRIGGALAEQSHGSSGGARARRLRSTLVIAEIALSLVLLAGAALLLVSFRQLVNVSTGFQPAHLVFSRVTLPGSRYGEHARTVAFFDALLERLRAMPGIERATATTSLPFDGQDSQLDLAIEHRTTPSQQPQRAHLQLVSIDYFQTLRIPLVRGRLFTEHDSERSGNVVIINEAAARRYWPAENPIGRRISFGDDDDWREIVGIVSDVRQEGLDADADPAAFLPQHQRFVNLGTGFERTVSIVIRTAADPRSTTTMLRSAVAAIDTQLPTGIARTMEDLIDESVAPRRLNFVLVSTFAIVAVLLTAVGLYGVMAYIVLQRTREIGVRMALGATSAQVLAMMFVEAGRLTGGGIAIGIAGALVLTRSMSSLLFGVGTADPLVYGAVSALLAAVAFLAVAVPVARATRVDPLAALHES